MGESFQSPFLRKNMTGDPRLRGKPVGSAPFAGSGKVKPKPKPKAKSRKRVGPKTMQRTPKKRGVETRGLGKPSVKIGPRKRKFNPKAGSDR
jgi:hypothetical protein